MKKGLLKKAVSVVLMAAMAVSITACGGGASNSDEIKIGMLFDKSGGMALFDSTCYNGAMLAVNEINENGGINGKKLVTVEEDYAGDVSTALEKSKKLIMEDKVAAVVGGAWSFYAQSAFEENDGLLLYPVYYQGEMDTDNMVVTGFLPNQQSFYLINYLMNNNLGKKFYLVGSDYEYPLVSFNQAKALIEKNGGEVVGEEFVPLGHSDFSSVTNKIKEAQPDIVLTALAGDSVMAFHKQLQALEWDFDDIKIASLTLDDLCTGTLEPAADAGTYLSFPWLQALDTEASNKFKKAYTDAYGEDSITTLCEGTEESYDAVMLLAQALEKTDDYSGEGLMEAFKGLEFDAPCGKIKVDPETLHTSYSPLIGQVQDDGTISILEVSGEMIEPEPWSSLLYPDGAPE